MATGISIGDPHPAFVLWPTTAVSLVVVVIQGVDVVVTVVVVVVFVEGRKLTLGIASSMTIEAGGALLTADKGVRGITLSPSTLTGTTSSSLLLLCCTAFSSNSVRSQPARILSGIGRFLLELPVVQFEVSSQ